MIRFDVWEVGACDSIVPSWLVIRVCAWAMRFNWDVRFFPRLEKLVIRVNMPYGNEILGRRF